MVRSTTQRVVPRPLPCAVPPRVVRAIALDARRAEAGAPALAFERRDGVDEREELGDVVSIRTRERDHQRWSCTDSVDGSLLRNRLTAS